MMSAFSYADIRITSAYSTSAIERTSAYEPAAEKDVLEFYLWSNKLTRNARFNRALVPTVERG